MERVDYFKRWIPGLLKRYKIEDIFNIDGYGLFYRVMPNKTLTMARDKCKDGNISRKRKLPFCLLVQFNRRETKTSCEKENQKTNLFQKG